MKYFSIWPDCWLHCKIIHILCCTLVNFIMCSFFLFLNFLEVDQQTDFAGPHSNQLEAELGYPPLILLINKWINFSLNRSKFMWQRNLHQANSSMRKKLVLSSHQEGSCGCSFRYWFHFNKQFGLYFVISKLLRSCNWCINKIYHMHSSFCNNFPWETLL